MSIGNCAFSVSMMSFFPSFQHRLVSHSGKACVCVEQDTPEQHPTFFLACVHHPANGSPFQCLDLIASENAHCVHGTFPLQFSEAGICFGKKANIDDSHDGGMEVRASNRSSLC